MKYRILWRKSVVATAVITASVLVLPAHSAENPEDDEAGYSLAEPSNDVPWEVRFDDVDNDDSNSAEWPEIEDAYRTQLEQAGWSRDDTVKKFDRNQDGRLQETEYLLFMSGLESAVREEKQ